MKQSIVASASRSPDTASIASGERSSRRRVLWLTAVGTLVITALLQLWRPHFHLSDDNLSGYLPSATEFGRKLWAGAWPFVSDGVFGGGHDLLRDPSVFSLLSPWMLLFSWLSLTPFYYLLVDVVSLCNSLAIALAFCWSAMWLRDHFELGAPDWLIVALSVSYTFTPYNLLVGSSWLGFLNGQAALPLIFVGFFLHSWGKAVLLQSAALLYALMGGHAHVFVMLFLFSGVLALGVALHTRRVTPLGRIALAGCLATLVALPVLAPVITGFADSPRAAGVPVFLASARRIPVAVLFMTLVFGPLATLLATALGQYSDAVSSTLSVGYSAANLLFMLTVVVSFRRRSLPPVGLVLLACFLVTALMVVRPRWLGEVIAHIPLLRSLQWPFREVWVLLFAIHMYVLFTAAALSKRVTRSMLALGAAVMLGILFSPPPTFYAFDLDRRLVISGVAEQFWAQRRREHGAAPRIVVGIDPAFMTTGRDEIPFSLLGTYNFGSIYGFISESGYTFTASLRSDGNTTAIRPYYFSGSYTPADAHRYVENRPDVWLIELAGLHPAEWTIRTAGMTRRFRYLAAVNQVIELR